MSVIVLTGGPGSPGVTTTSLGLTLCWPGDVMLSDCDRDPAQAIPAGYLRGLDLGGRGELFRWCFVRGGRGGGTVRPRVTDDAEAVYDEDLRLRAGKAPPEEPDSRTHRLPLGDGDGEAIEA